MKTKAEISLKFTQDDLNALFCSLLANSNDAIALIDTELKLCYANDRFAMLMGASPETVIGSYVELVLPGWARPIREICQEVRYTGKAVKSNVELLKCESRPELGGHSWKVNVSPVHGGGGRLVGWLIILEKVAEPKKGEAEKAISIREIEAQLKFFSKLGQGFPVGIVLIDATSFRVKLVNQTYLKFLNKPFRSEDMLENSFGDYLPRHTRSKILEVLHRVAATGEAVSIELLPQGKEFWNCNVVPILDEAWVRDIMFTVYNITEQVLNRRKTVESARRAESHLRQLEAVIENMEDGVIIFDLSGKIWKTNNAALQILGYEDVKDCPGNLFDIRADLKFYDLKGNPIPEDQLPLDRIRRGEIVRTFEAAVWRISTGRMRYLSYNGTLIKDANQTLALAVLTIRDISAREKLLRKLEKEHSNLQVILEQLPCGVVMYDASSLKQVLANKKYTEILGGTDTGWELNGEAPTGKLFYSDGPAYGDRELPIFRSINNGEIVPNEEMICQTKEGSISIMCNSTPILDTDGSIRAGMMVLTDITELKEATAKAALANQLQQIIEFLPDGIFVVDQVGKVIAWNRAIELLTGVLKADVIGTEFGVYMFDGVDQLMLFKAIFEGLDHETEVRFERTGDVLSKQVLIASLNQRENVMLDIKATPIRDEHGIILSVIETIRDITELKKLEAETTRMQKLESLGILAGGIAHDFNNVLAAILANLQLATLKSQKHQDISKNLENTIETTKKASNLTRQLLTFAKGGVPIKKTISITNLVRDTVQFALSGSNVKAVFSLPENLWPVDADEGQLTQVINNLTINAEQAMPTGGIIEISGENIVCEAGGKYNPGRYVKITVKDHGSGISEEIIHKIFDPFFTTKKLGSGLGLSTTYSIIKKHGGYLEVESAPGTGATFDILLPASMEESEVKESPGMLNIARVEAKILLLDDEDTFRNVSGELLTFFGYRVMLAKDGREAIKLYQTAKEKGDPFAAVIMDLTIPGSMGGLETLLKLRQYDPEIKAIVSSGYANDPVISNYENYGFSGMVIKPYKFDDLIVILDKVIEKRQLSLDFIY